MMDDQMRSHDDSDPTNGDAVGEVPAPPALRALGDVVAPDRLRRAVGEAVARAERTPRRARRRPRLGGVLVGAAGVLLAVMAFGFFAQRLISDSGSSSSGGVATPSVRQVAQVALRSAAAPAPAVRPGGETLTARAGSIAFPTWTRAGWRAVGERTDAVGGHELRTVFYVDGDGRRIGYAIADAALPAGGGHVVVRRGVPVRVLAQGATAVVTWRRDGHTCILAGRGVPVGKLVTLASYSA